ncbi:HesA/MoeB/ThiF family protein [Caulobacter segnis]
MDPDAVSLSNLQRQVLYATADVDRAPRWRRPSNGLSALNPHTAIAVKPTRYGWTPPMPTTLVSRHDLVLDGTDDFATRFAVSDACLAHGKPPVSGALGRWTGQVGVFHGKPCYRAASYPRSRRTPRPAPWSAWSGPLAGVIGSMMALEAAKLVKSARASPCPASKLLI